jgi:uracil-DNA glycosylase
MKIKISELFDAYRSQVKDTPKIDDIFSKSGMVNEFEELDFGFFPLGSGIFSEKCKTGEAEIEQGGVMVLGNDFGTLHYVTNDCEDKRENNSKTIKNLQKVGLEMDKTFFTNFFLGLRDNINHPGTTMTKLIIKREKEYIDFCFNFFLTQLKIINPTVVICIGKEVGFALFNYFPEAFPIFNRRDMTYSKLYEAEEKIYEVLINNTSLGKRKFIFIPHPSWAHINWKKNNIELKIKMALQD